MGMGTQLPPLPVPAVLKLIRPHHWVKSGFVAAPLFFTPAAMTMANVWLVGLAVLCWSFVASAIYILNDWRDVKTDRTHPTKKSRPLAAGTVSTRTAFILMLVLAGAGLAGAWCLSPVFFSYLLGYGLLNIAYSLRLKHIAVIDVMCIALGFVLRIQAGAALISVDPSAWIVILTGLLALFLGFAKRRDDLVKSLGGEHRRSLDGYNRAFIDIVLAITLGAALVSYLIYTTDPGVQERLHSDKLFYTAPFVIYGMLRYLQLTIVKERSGSPTAVVLSDIPTILAGLGWVLTFALLIYS
jgi:decaprenyl-phosphate phosphoribosyltransferase